MSRFTNFDPFDYSFNTYRAIDLRTNEQKLKDAETELKKAEDRVTAANDAKNKAALEVVRARTTLEATERADIIKSLHAGLDGELKPLSLEELRALKAAHLAFVARK
jgi:hypothetical protein